VSASALIIDGARCDRCAAAVPTSVNVKWKSDYYARMTHQRATVIERRLMPAAPRIVMRAWLTACAREPSSPPPS